MGLAACTRTTIRLGPQPSTPASLHLSLRRKFPPSSSSASRLRFPLHVWAPLDFLARYPDVEQKSTATRAAALPTRAGGSRAVHADGEAAVRIAADTGEESGLDRLADRDVRQEEVEALLTYLGFLRLRGTYKGGLGTLVQYE